MQCASECSTLIRTRDKTGSGTPVGIYFCINDLIDALADAPDGTDPAQILVTVAAKTPDCDGHSDDAMTLSSQPNILNMNEPAGVYKLATLLDEVPLYHINMELLLDKALTIRHHNHLVDTALLTAFGGQALPNTLQRTDGPSDATIVIEGSLRHPMIGHVDRVTLAKIYMNFYRALTHGHEDFDFETHILGRHPEPFRTQFDGYLIGARGAMRADILLGFGIRADYDPRRPLEKYVEDGKKRAKAMQLSDPRELCWAWMEADAFQTRRCRDLDRLLSRLPALGKTAKSPAWIRTDVFHCLEREAMKQVFAAQMVAIDPDLRILGPNAHNTRAAINTNAKGGLDDALQVLLSDTLIPDAKKSETARRFHEGGHMRQRETAAL